LFAGAQRYFHLVCDGARRLLVWRHEMVLRCGSGGGIAAGWGLLAHGIGREYCGAAADAGDWVSSLQTGNRREIAGAAIFNFLAMNPRTIPDIYADIRLLGGICGKAAGSESLIVHSELDFPALPRR